MPKKGILTSTLISSCEIKPKSDAERADVHQCYQEAVQNPRKELLNIIHFYRQVRSVAGHSQKMPLLLREDFCGTAILCQEWVDRNVQREAIGVDLDPNVLKYGKEHFADECISSRISLVRGNVLSIDNELIKKADILVAFNYGVCYFHTRDLLTRYLRQVRSALKLGGVFICDGFGGRRSLFENFEFRRRCSTFDYIFEQSSMSCLTNTCIFSLSYKFRDGSWRKKAFVYEFRIWSVAELLEALREVGFANIQVWIGENKMVDFNEDFDYSDQENQSLSDKEHHFCSGSENNYESSAFIRLTPNFSPKSDTWNIYIAALNV